MVPLPANQNSEFARGELKVLERVHGRPTYFEIKQANGTIWRFGKPIAASAVARSPDRATTVDEDDDWFDEDEAEKEPIRVDEELIEVAGGQGWSVDPMGLSAAPRSPGGAGITMDPNG